MPKGEITINEVLCAGCSFCAEFCARGCIEMSKDKFNAKGYLLPLFSAPDRCNACGVCAWMCPEFAIDVDKFAEAAAPANSA